MFNMINSFQIIAHIPFYDLRLPTFLVIFLANMQEANLNFIDNEAASQAIYKFRLNEQEPYGRYFCKMDVCTTHFLVNTLETFVHFEICLAIVVFVALLNTLSFSKTSIYKPLNNALSKLLLYIIEAFLPYGMFSLLEFVTPEFGTLNQTIAFLSACFFTAIVLIAFPFCFFYLALYKRNQNAEKLFHCLFEGYKETKWGRMYYGIFIIRRLIYVFTITFLKGYNIL